MKPQIERVVLDEADASPHLGRMAEDRKSKTDAPQTREAKLAEALRANLRRRKAGAAQAPAQKTDKPTTD